MTSEVNPFELFKAWYKEASVLSQYNAMSLATSSIDAIPSVRMVLLKGYSGSCFTFYTNTNSNKGSDLQNNPSAEILFFWKELEKQIRIAGIIERASNEESDRYFASRSRGSQISAWASQQSQIMPHNQALNNRCKEMESRFINVEKIPRPKFWSGFVLIPSRFEFWQEQEHRLHLRYQYKLTQKEWQISRLYP